MRHQLDSRLTVLDKYVEKVDLVPEGDELKTYLCKFGAVQICGNIERSIEIIVLSRLQDRAQPRVLNFIKSHFMRGMNLDCEAIQQLLARFDSEWYRKFSHFVEQNHDVKEGVASCYSIRNSAAHGGSQGVGIARLRELLEAHRRLLEAVVASTA